MTNKIKIKSKAISTISYLNINFHVILVAYNFIAIGAIKGAPIKKLIILAPRALFNLIENNVPSSITKLLIIRVFISIVYNEIKEYILI
ncbi:hypothetical protein [Caloranaerobacter azorensis]|uniref:hypothetical protein n=1 Tax=Caloranaerobacter azorensis TaxID=116090 RepID=UPI0012E0356B|nr:hypothetical protein [Caloranaerobacter azorensis]